MPSSSNNVDSEEIYRNLNFGMAMGLFGLSTLALLIPLVGNLDIAKPTNSNHTYGLHYWKASGCTGECETSIENSFILGWGALASLFMTIGTFSVLFKPDNRSLFSIGWRFFFTLCIPWLIFSVHAVYAVIKDTHRFLAIIAAALAGAICAFFTIEHSLNIYKGAKQVPVEYYKNVLAACISCAFGFTAPMWWFIHDGFGGSSSYKFEIGAYFLHTSSFSLLCAVPFACLFIGFKPFKATNFNIFNKSAHRVHAEIEQLVGNNGATESHSVDNWKF